MFLDLLISNGSLTRKYIWWNNKLYLFWRTLIDLNPDLNLSSKIYFPNKMEGENFSISIKITWISEMKTLIKHISCNGRCKFDGRKCNSNQKLNNGKGWYDCKYPIKHQVCKKDYVWNLSTCECEKYYEIDKYLKLALP